MKPVTIFVAFIGYIIAFIVTYGHAYHQLGSDFAGERG